jgi:hypothetical protein
MPTGKIYLGSTLISDPAAGGGPALWTPANTTTELWLDGSDPSTITLSTGGVSQWNDKSGNARHFTQGTSGDRPQLGIQGGKYMLDFAADFLTSSSAASTWKFLHDSTGSSVFVVAKAGIIANPNALLPVIGTNALDPVNAGCSLFYDDRSAASRNNYVAGYITRGGGNAVANAFQNNVWPAETLTIVGAISDPSNGTAASRQRIRINGGTEYANNTETNTPSNSNPSYTLQIGRAGNSAGSFSGSIAEVVIASGQVSSTIREKIEGYLAWKWGIEGSLPGGHPYISAAPTV